MANNRLYIVNSDTKEYVCIAKSSGDAWNLGNVSLLKTFLENISGSENQSPLIIGAENDKSFYESYIENGENHNHQNIWVYE